MTVVEPERGAAEAVAANAALLVANDLVKTFGNGVRAVDGVSLTVHPGETVGLVGESGCGKSTTAKMILRLLAADGGSLSFGGVDLLHVRGRALRKLRARMQLVPQNPQTSFNPRLSIRSSIEFNLRAHGVQRGARGARLLEALDRVGMPAAYAQRFPHELSGGQLQRAAIARALVTNPELIVCDEAVSALDKSIQAQVLNLLVELQRDLGVAYLFISHDLSVVEHLSDRVIVMYLGRVVEEATAEQLWRDPRHPYTEALLSAAPNSGRTRIMLAGDPPSPTDPPSGCTFRTRCPVALEACAEERPPLLSVGGKHFAACINQERVTPAAVA
ncbi:MAG: ABC transporter ATP-binding protein [Acidimicrobiales bacterium]|nr:ABC transporter ATP-binding protein [Acidimicrobiales bacterium]